jgi:hypothetical protein
VGVGCRDRAQSKASSRHRHTSQPTAERAFRDEVSASEQSRQPVAPSPISVADELTKLVTLRDSGILTSEEYEAQKAKLLDGEIG